jgi:N-acetylmuramoyl-L-alanine amidase
LGGGERMSKVFLGVGHGGKDFGASANNLKEKDINLSIALFCRDELIRHNVEVLMSRITDEDDPLTDEIKECNAFDPDCAMDIHTNAGSGDGFEVYHSIGSTKGEKLANLVNAEVLLIGQNSRGVKTRANSTGKDYYGFVRDTKCPAIITECAFIDNIGDISIADELAEQKKFGIAYAKGILKYLGIEWKDEIVEPDYKSLYENTLSMVETQKLLNDKLQNKLYKIANIINEN